MYDHVSQLVTSLALVSGCSGRDICRPRLSNVGAECGRLTGGITRDG